MPRFDVPPFDDKLIGGMQQRELVRTRGLAAFRAALVDAALPSDGWSTLRQAILVPTRAAASLLRLAIEQRMTRSGRRAVLLPEFLTRDEWLQRLAAALPGSPRWLSRSERLVLFEHAARQVLSARRGLVAPFDLRPGLLAAILDFYDELRRRQRRVRSFARAIFDELRVERGMDRGSEELIEQTRFLGFTFLAYDRAVAESGGVDEHHAVGRLLEHQPDLPFEDLVLAVADHPADLRGLCPIDFDLIGRLRGLARVRVVMTDEAHDAGFRARVEQELPGIVEQRAPDVIDSSVLVASTLDATTVDRLPVAMARDREEELRQVARHVRASAAADGGRLVHASAVVFHRPLPYLYLARHVFDDARVPYQAFDALPLAAEPSAAFLDLALAVARTDGARAPTLALLRSPLGIFEQDGHPVTAADVGELERVLIDRRAEGPASSFEEQVSRAAPGGSRVKVPRDRLYRTARAAGRAAAALVACRTAPAGSAQVAALLDFLRRHGRAPLPADERGRRARSAVLLVLESLRDAFARHDDRQRSHDELAAFIYQLLEAQTFAPGRGSAGGLYLVDAVSSRFGEFDDVFLVGLVDSDWAERQRRNVFYSAGLLGALGWPQDAEQIAAQRAAFRDVLGLARRRTRLSAFQLDAEAAVGLSTMIDAAAALPRGLIVDQPPGAIFADERLTGDRVLPAGDAVVDAWIEARLARPALQLPAYSGRIGAHAAEVYRVSQVDRYVSCPFKYYAAHVLRLEEERPGVVGLTPLERGTFLHELLERFFGEWQRSEGGAVTLANLPRAHAVFAAVADDLLRQLPTADQAVERLRIVGSIVAPGIAGRVLEAEIAAGIPVVGRMLEVPIEGPFSFPQRSGLSSRVVPIRGKADRVDILQDGAIRVIDYKLGRMPDLDQSIQVAVYAHCVRQQLASGTTAAPQVAAAMYVAFGEDRRLAGGMTGRPEEVTLAVEARAGQFADIVDRIESGAFEVRPLETSDCQWCGYAGVCRKEYAADDEHAAEPV
jgi:RecB family exonuclease